MSNEPSLSRRLFFALWPSELEREGIHETVQPQVLAVGGRAIQARNLHVTLAFLGAVPEESIEKIIALAGRVGRCGAIDLAFDRLEVWKRSRVLVIVPRIVPPALKELAEQLHFNLLNEQFEVGHEEYRPHLTIARDARRALELDLATPILCRFERFSLVESKNASHGSIYRNLHNWELIQ